MSQQEYSSNYSQPKQELYQSYKPTSKPCVMTRGQYTYTSKGDTQRQFICKCGVSTTQPSQHLCNYGYKKVN